MYYPNETVIAEIPYCEIIGISYLKPGTCFLTSAGELCMVVDIEESLGNALVKSLKSTCVLAINLKYGSARTFSTSALVIPVDTEIEYSKTTKEFKEEEEDDNGETTGDA